MDGYVETLAMSEVGPQGFSGQELFADAETRYGAFSVTWNGTPDVSPGSDVFSLTFGASTAEHRQAWSTECIGDPSAVPPDYLQVNTQATLQNTDGSVFATLDLEMIAPNFDAQGVQLRALADVEVSGDYLDHLLVDNPSGVMTVELHSLAIETFLDRGSVEDWPQRITLTRLFENDDSGGAAMTYGCAHDTVCITTLSP